MLKITDLSASHGIIQVLFNISFEVRDGESVAFVGANGAGKSTTLNVISGLMKPGNGTITFMDRLINDMPSDKRIELGLIQVPEGGTVFPYLSVMENLMMGASSNPQAWKERKTGVERAIRLFPILKDRARLQARSLSGGERQMLAVARGLMAHPKLLMIDEPSIGLAPKILLLIYSTLRILRDEGVTILLSEQNVQEALKLCSRAYVLENGKIVMSGLSKDILNSERIKKAYLGM